MNIIFGIFKKLGLAGIMQLVKKLNYLLQHQMKLYAAIYYVKAVKTMRRAVLALFFLMLIVMIISSGFVLLNMGVAALVFHMTGNFKSVAIYFAISGAVFFVCPVVLFLWLNTERKWLRICNVDNVVNYCEISKQINK